MNVIFEYGNTQSNLCDLLTFAQKWIDLSSFTRGSTDYMNALAVITQTVTDSNAASSKPNGSAINRVRTNERIFFSPGMDAIQDLNRWEVSDWEFRQFEIDPSTHYLKQATLTNTPVDDANYPNNISLYPTYSQEGTFNLTPVTVPTDALNLIDWVFNPVNMSRVYNGTYSMPNTYSSLPLAAAVAHVNGKYAHYWDFYWGASTTNYNDVFMYSPPSPIQKQLRHQLSLNTCSGCHAGETKTEFTQIRPLGIDEPADYWSSTPSDYYLHEIVSTCGATNYRTMDNRFKSNSGYTAESGGNVLNYNDGATDSNEYHMKVSAFLTGRNYRGSGSTTPGFGDDSTTGNSSMNGLFYVNDPANDAIGIYIGHSLEPQPGNTKYGYNDLLRRKNDLCDFAYTNCGLTEGTSEIMQIMKNVAHKVFPKGSH